MGSGSVAIEVKAENSSPEEVRTQFAVLGAGPTGIGAAWRLSQPGRGKADGVDRDNDSFSFLLLDESSTPGGRAASITTPEGFTFDYGGHVLFPHAEYGEFIALLTRIIPEWHSSIPIRGVWIANRLVPTPVQRNIHRLPRRVMAACLWGLWRRKTGEESADEPNLRQYLETQFGTELTRRVMSPLNQKMWARPPDELGSAWSGHRSGSKEKNIPDVSVGGILLNWLLNRDEPGWTAATKVRYPLRGGCGAIWERIFASLPERGRRLKARVQAIDSARKRLCLTDGSMVHYDRLVTSIPLDLLLKLIRDQPSLQARAHEFRAAKVQIFGFGLEGEIPPVLRGVHAISVPAPEIPFWRVNIPSNFSPGNVPDAARNWSILCESSIAAGSNVQFAPRQIEAALREMGLIPHGSKVVSVFSTALEHGYPVPFAGREKLLNEVQQRLESLNIFSRGRFGGWRYEVSNQDHAFMQGVEVIDRLREGKTEYTYRKTW